MLRQIAFNLCSPLAIPYFPFTSSVPVVRCITEISCYWFLVVACQNCTASRFSTKIMQNMQHTLFRCFFASSQFFFSKLSDDKMFSVVCGENRWLYAFRSAEKGSIALSSPFSKEVPFFVTSMVTRASSRSSQWSSPDWFFHNSSKSPSTSALTVWHRSVGHDCRCIQIPDQIES